MSQRPGGALSIEGKLADQGNAAAGSMARGPPLAAGLAPHPATLPLTSSTGHPYWRRIQLHSNTNAAFMTPDGLLKTQFSWKNRLHFKAMLLVRDEDLSKFHGECMRDAPPWTPDTPIEEQALIGHCTALLGLYNKLCAKYQIADFRFIRDLRTPPNAAWHIEELEHTAVVAGGNNRSIAVRGDSTPISFSINRGCHTLPLAEAIFKRLQRAGVDTTFTMHADCAHSQAPPPTHYTVTLAGDGAAASELDAEWSTIAKIDEDRSPGDGHTSQPGPINREETGADLKWHRQLCLATTGQPLDHAQSVSVSINLAHVTQRDLNRIATTVKRIVKAATAFSSHRPFKGHKHSDTALDFLRTITLERFALALKRYDSWVTGDTFSKIASAETNARLSESPPRRLKGTSADQVENDIKQIHFAIHRQPLKARRRRTDAPAIGFEQYHCPQHGRGCLEDCDYMKDWYRKVRRVLPPDVGRAIRRGPERSRRRRARHRL
jgi:hypothetical protein